jgi:hypothetical protein
MEKINLEAKGISLRCNFESGYSCFFEGPCKGKEDKFETFGFNFLDNRAYNILPKDYLISTVNKNG